MKIAVVGATGLVGRKMLEILEERNVKISELLLAASEKSVGKVVSYRGKEHKLLPIPEVIKAKPEAAIFSAGADASKRWAKEFAEAGCYVIDNSSAWRMNNEVPLVVPEVNPDTITEKTKIIANPNCSTIGLVVAMFPLHKAFNLKRMVISTYQSVSGSGSKGINQLMGERKGNNEKLAYPHQIDLNVIPHGGIFLDNGYTSEEIKLINESRKIMGIPDLNVTGTVVRVPVLTSHSESVNAEFETDFSIEQVRQVLENAEGVLVWDNPAQYQYPMPAMVAGSDLTFVGRLRKDLFQPKTLNLWVVSDNVRKGAATNAVQILEYLITKKLINE